MKQKMGFTILTLIGLLFIFSGSAWASRDHRHGPAFDKRPHYGHFDRRQHGWTHGRGHHHHRFRHGPHHRGWSHRHAHRRVEKHVYHHYAPDDRYAYDDRYDSTESLAEPGFAFSLGISGIR